MTGEPNNLCDFPVPEGWSFYPDENGGGLVSPDRAAILHLHAERVEDPTQLPNLSRMLAGFLTHHHKPVATDELLAIKLPGAIGFAWQYAEDQRAIRVWVLGNEKAWCFLNFQAPLESEAEYRPTIDNWVKEFRFRQ